ncbi:MAG TPA: FtsQ-type POTRA domain-containing protein [Aggregatilineales bacterium]|nr:FtsQ-type POTRA domain-containing protein [Aggregatilineales bacterium]
MNFTGRRNQGHVKPKRKRSGETSDETHVKPAAGREARRLRMEKRREARQERSVERVEEPVVEVKAPPELKSMRPRPWAGGRRRRERPTRKAGISEASRQEERVRPRGVVWLSWRWVSGSLTAVLLIVLIVLLFSDAFYVNSVAVGGVNYLTREEVFRFSGVSQKHIFWVDVKEVENQLKSSNNISDAQVRVGWPPHMVQIIVRERDPVLIWEQGNDRVWVDVNGMVMFQREDRSDLLRVVYDPNEPQPPGDVGPNTRIPVEIVHGALLLESRLPGIDVLLYHPVKWLGGRDPRGWMAWFGVGDNMAMKARVYTALIDYNSDKLQFGEIDVSDPDNPVYSILWQKSETN